MNTFLFKLHKRHKQAFKNLLSIHKKPKTEFSSKSSKLMATNLIVLRIYLTLQKSFHVPSATFTLCYLDYSD